MNSGSWLFLNIDELLYRFHLYIAEPIIRFLSFNWLFRDSGAARAVEEGSLGVAQDAGFFDRFFTSGFFRIFSSRPSQEYDSVQEYLEPTADKNLFELIWGLLFGTGDKESVLAIMMSSFLFWVILVAILAFVFRKYLAGRIHFMEAKHELLYEMAQTKYVEKQANNKADRWQRILQQVSTEDVNQWKIAIVDADILLDDVLSEQGYTGRDLSDKLQDARREGKLGTLEYAAEAHGVRNRIAHDSSYNLSHREAKSAIAMYERFFNEVYAS